MPNAREGFLDIHTHILPGLDDGPKTLEESLALARIYQATGITTIVATPHFLPGTAWAPAATRVLEGVAALNSELGQRGLDLTVLPGMEIAHHKKMAERILAGTLLPLGNSGHYLVEPSFQGEQDELLSCLGSLLDQGIKIILAHPERAEGFQKSPKALSRHVARGLKIQVNSGSLLGHFGEKSRRTAELFAQENMLHLIASDAHDAARRSPLGLAEWRQVQALPGGADILSTCRRTLHELFAAASPSQP